ncbi:alpha-scruin, partial [Patella vulgata]|uniref:alpha-scruin n=1 Tax=Patella vulgata TaxID=6465 RepID=UPI002180967F
TTNQAQKHIERYYSNDNQWKYYAELPEPRHHHAVAFLGGKLYLSGGTGAKKTFTKRHPLPLKKVFQFDPGQKVWRECALMNSSRMYHKMCALYGMLYAIGGQDEKTRVLASVECYNNKTNSWIYARPMNSARMGFGAAVNDGKIYVAGGHGEHLDKKTELPILQSVEAFDPRTNQWVTMSDLRIPRCFCCLVSIGSGLYLCGGASSSYPAAKDGTFSSVGLIEMFDPAKNKWEFKAEMGLPRHHHGVAVIGTKIFLVGGMSTTNFQTLKSVECFDTVTETWDNSVRDMPMPAKWICCSVLPVAKH